MWQVWQHVPHKCHHTPYGQPHTSLSKQTCSYNSTETNQIYKPLGPQTMLGHMIMPVWSHCQNTDSATLATMGFFMRTVWRGPGRSSWGVLLWCNTHHQSERPQTTSRLSPNIFHCSGHILVENMQGAWGIHVKIVHTRPSCAPWTMSNTRTMCQCMMLVNQSLHIMSLSSKELCFWM